MSKLPGSFYQRDDVLLIAKELMGKILATKWDGVLTSGRIVECEAYAGPADRASHAVGGRRTNRNEIMYAPGGLAYVYLCYGIHHMFNVVTHGKGVPHAILIRALEPLKGIAEMERRRKTNELHHLCRGPGNLAMALGIRTNHNGTSLRSKELFIEDDGFSYTATQIKKSPRIGVDYAGEHAAWPYRFYVKGNPNVSGKVK